MKIFNDLKIKADNYFSRNKNSKSLSTDIKQNKINKSIKK